MHEQDQRAGEQQSMHSPSRLAPEVLMLSRLSLNDTIFGIQERAMVNKGPDTQEWLIQCIDELKAKYKDDRFGVVARQLQPGTFVDAPREWRIKCFDCPGQLYYIGPGETLTNFTIHLKNKYHRQNVNTRLTREGAGTL